jgi:hypothetical protein
MDYPKYSLLSIETNNFLRLHELTNGRARSKPNTVNCKTPVHSAALSHPCRDQTDV